MLDSMSLTDWKLLVFNSRHLRIPENHGNRQSEQKMVRTRQRTTVRNSGLAQLKVFEYKLDQLQSNSRCDLLDALMMR